MAKKKTKRLAKWDLTLKLPVPVIAFYHGVAAYAGVTVSEAVCVVLSLSRCASDPALHPRRSRHARSPR